MQVVVDADYLELLISETEPRFKHSSGEYSPFTGKRVPVVSLDDIKNLLSSPKAKQRELLLDLSNNY